MTVINNEKCIGCGSCINDCVFGTLKIENGKATLDGQCIKCGHCVAICPSQAVSIPEYEMSEVEDYDKNRFAIDMDNLLYTVKFRRSMKYCPSPCRSFIHVIVVIYVKPHSFMTCNPESRKLFVTQRYKWHPIESLRV